MAGFRTITIPSADDGGVDLDAFRTALGPRTAAIMITNPSTLGLFERRIGELLEATHAAGALASGDIKGKVGESFMAGKLGKYTIVKGAGGPEVVLGPPFLFTKQNVDKFKF